eukprot:1190827-Pleurochrysis_carterae.AAC.3
MSCSAHLTVVRRAYELLVVIRRRGGSVRASQRARSPVSTSLSLALHLALSLWSVHLALSAVVRKWHGRRPRHRSTTVCCLARLCARACCPTQVSELESRDYLCEPKTWSRIGHSPPRASCPCGSLLNVITLQLRLGQEYIRCPSVSLRHIALAQRCRNSEANNVLLARAEQLWVREVHVAMVTAWLMVTAVMIYCTHACEVAVVAACQAVRP